MVSVVKHFIHLQLQQYHDNILEPIMLAIQHGVVAQFYLLALCSGVVGH